MQRDVRKAGCVCVLLLSFCHPAFASMTFSPAAPAGGEAVAVTFAEPFNCAAQAPLLKASSTGSYAFESILPSGLVNCPFVPSPPPDYSTFTVNLGLLSAGTYTVTWNNYLNQDPDAPRLLSSESSTLVVTAGGGATLSPGYTGNWYGPGSSGHGFSIEVLPGNTMLAEWFVFAPFGGQAWIQASGPIVGNAAVLQAYYPAGAGGHFPPNFDPAQLEDRFWGTLDFSFADCNSGQASWLPAAGAYASGYSGGSMPIARLTMPAGLSCP